MKKAQLMGIIEQMTAFPPGKARLDLEQYATDAATAVEMAFIAGFMHDDCRDRVIIDLGTGTGRLAVVSLYFGARKAIGIEIDETAILLARENARQLGLEGRLDLIHADVHHLPLRGTSPKNFGKEQDVTIVMNPPFGVHGKGADVRFLTNAMQVQGARVIYSFHLALEKNREYLKSKVEKCGWKVAEIHQTTMILPRLYRFHEKKRKEVKVDIYRILLTTDNLCTT